MDPIGTVRATFRAGSFAAWTSSAVIYYHLLSRLEPRYAAWPDKQRVIHGWTQGLVPILGLDLDVAGTLPQPGRPLLVVANHRSPIDILLCIHLVGGVVLAHDGVAAIPIVGPAARVNETIFVNTENRQSGAWAVRQMRRCLREGRNVIAFPEGDTFRGDEVRPFQPGSFAAARGLDGVEVLPMGLAYQSGAEFVDESFGTHLFRMSAHPRTRTWVRFGEPCPVPRRGEEEALRHRVQVLVDAAAEARDRSS